MLHKSVLPVVQVNNHSRGIHGLDIYDELLERTDSLSGSHWQALKIFMSDNAQIEQLRDTCTCGPTSKCLSLDINPVGLGTLRGDDPFFALRLSILE